MKRLNVAACCMCLGLALAMPAWAQTEQHDHNAKPGAIKAGTVDFQTSCSPAVKDDFNLAVAELHSFWFPEARALFESHRQEGSQLRHGVLGRRADVLGQPVCRPAFGRRSLPTARPRSTRRSRPARRRPREKGYIDAVAGLFSSADVTTQRARVVAYEGATELVASQNRDDVEARIFWALAIAQTALPTDKTFAQNLKAAEILEPLYKQMPNHPGLAHYIIHAYDVPALAAKALPAARAYADIAPSVPHALHMPSHTFTRVGEWKESVDDQHPLGGGSREERQRPRRRPARARLHDLRLPADGHGRPGQGRASSTRRTVAAKAAAAPGAADAGGANTFALAAIPARYAMERGQWADATMLKPYPAPNTPYTEAITHFARAIGFARSGKPAEAAADIARLTALRDREIEMKDAYWTEQVDIQRRGAEAWVMFAEGKKAEAIAAMSAVADAEDKTDKSAVTPGPHRAGARDVRLHAARGRPGQGSAGRVRSGDQEGAEPLPRALRRRQGGRSHQADGPRRRATTGRSSRSVHGRRHRTSRTAVRAQDGEVVMNPTGGVFPGGKAPLAGSRTPTGSPRPASSSNPPARSRRSRTPRRGPTSAASCPPSAAHRRTRRSGTASTLSSARPAKIIHFIFEWLRGPAAGSRAGWPDCATAATVTISGSSQSAGIFRAPRSPLLQWLQSIRVCILPHHVPKPTPGARARPVSRSSAVVNAVESVSPSICGNA